MKKLLAPAVIATVGALSLTTLPAIADATASPTKTAEAKAAATTEKKAEPTSEQAKPAPEKTPAPVKKAEAKTAPAKKAAPAKPEPSAKPAAQAAPSAAKASPKAIRAPKTSPEPQADEKTSEAPASSVTPLFGDPVDAVEIGDHGLSVKLTGLKPNSKVFGTAYLDDNSVGKRTGTADASGDLTLQVPYQGSTTNLKSGVAIDVHLEYTSASGADGADTLTTHVGKEIEEAPLATLALDLPNPAPKQMILTKGFPVQIADVKPGSEVKTSVRLSTPGSPVVAEGSGTTKDDGTGRIEAKFTGDAKELTPGVIASVRVEYTRTDGTVYATTLSTAISDDATEEPTADPTSDPTSTPTDDPTSTPTDEPTTDPTSTPTGEPTTDPTEDPTAPPTDDPTDEPTTAPTETPTSPAPTSDPTDPPTSPGSHTNTEARLIVNPHRLTPAAFTNAHKGVDIAATKLEPGQAVTFTVKPHNSHVKAYSRTIVSNADGVAGWKLYGTNPHNLGAYVGTYDITASIPPVPDDAHGDSAQGEAAHAGGTVARAGAQAAQQDQQAKQGKTRVLEDSFTVGSRGGANPGDNGGDSGRDDTGSDNGDLPRTGAQLGGLAIGGTLLLVGGAVVMLTRRRTRD